MGGFDTSWSSRLTDTPSPRKRHFADSVAGQNHWQLYHNGMKRLKYYTKSFCPVKNWHKLSWNFFFHVLKILQKKNLDTKQAKLAPKKRLIADQRAENSIGAESMLEDATLLASDGKEPYKSKDIARYNLHFLFLKRPKSICDDFETRVSAEVLDMHNCATYSSFEPIDQPRH
ncbi:hypothetical protein PPACK8108_LOCUS6393 [Phakopsora pachyrhizi]|uniref:Uncharacterized protein n=1 Tax=Phakopsora pachyrhizi TaxID=170000 RepID=A0AAV0AUE0_PHAPC|nr:hypothetical protein PPACK8108_LOCUS6393 [Phakopsora pachyrhizi]